jgi:purine-cytosine permease-like protein
MVPTLLTIFSGVGFGVLNSIVGGQALASIADISWTCVVLRATQS